MIEVKADFGHQIENQRPGSSAGASAEGICGSEELAQLLRGEQIVLLDCRPSTETVPVSFGCFFNKIFSIFFQFLDFLQNFCFESHFWADKSFNPSVLAGKLIVFCVGIMLITKLELLKAKVRKKKGFEDQVLRNYHI